MLSSLKQMFYASPRFKGLTCRSCTGELLRIAITYKIEAGAFETR